MEFSGGDPDLVLDPDFGGDWDLKGRLSGASNATFLAQVGERLGVYKPVRGERPLGDFPDGTLACREVAAYRLSAAAGYDLVPATVLIDGPFGTGSLQAWVDPAEEDPVQVVGDGDDLRDRIPVIEAYGRFDEPLWVVHDNSDRLRELALFDLVANNADRKGGHVLAQARPDGPTRIFGIDHGICFHALDKVRTVLWGFAEEKFSDHHRELLQRSGEVAGELSELLSITEVIAIEQRVQNLLRLGRFPEPVEDRYPFPWPPL